jgi:hypothetical protein
MTEPDEKPTASVEVTADSAFVAHPGETERVDVTGHEAMCDFVDARLDDLERDAGLLGGTSGIITETWVKQHVEQSRTIVRLFRNNLTDSKESRSASGARWALKWSVFALADSFRHHEDYDSRRWGAP